MKHFVCKNSQNHKSWGNPHSLPLFEAFMQNQGEEEKMKTMNENFLIFVFCTFACIMHPVRVFVSQGLTSSVKNIGCKVWAQKRPQAFPLKPILISCLWILIYEGLKILKCIFFNFGLHLHEVLDWDKIICAIINTWLWLGSSPFCEFHENCKLDQ